MKKREPLEYRKFAATVQKAQAWMDRRQPKYDDTVNEGIFRDPLVSWVLSNHTISFEWKDDILVDLEFRGTFGGSPPKLRGVTAYLSTTWFDVITAWDDLLYRTFGKHPEITRLLDIDLTRMDTENALQVMDHVIMRSHIKSRMRIDPGSDMQRVKALVKKYTVPRLKRAGVQLGKAQAKLVAVTSPDRVLSRRFARSIASMQKLPGYTITSHGHHLRKSFTVPRGVHIVFIVPPGGVGFVSHTPMVLQDPSVARQIYAGATELSYRGNPLYAVHYVAGDVLHEFGLHFTDPGNGIYQFPMPRIHAHTSGLTSEAANTVRLSEAAYTLRFVPKQITLRELIRDVGKGVYVLTGCRKGDYGNAKNLNNSVLTDNAYVHRRQTPSSSNTISKNVHVLAANKVALSESIFLSNSMHKTIGPMFKETTNAVRAQLTNRNPYILVRAWLNIAVRSFYKPFNKTLVSTAVKQLGFPSTLHTLPISPGVVLLEYTVLWLGTSVDVQWYLNKPGWVHVTIRRKSGEPSEKSWLAIHNEKELDAASRTLISRIVV